jgi:hypothetical protein
MGSRLRISIEWPRPFPESVIRCVRRGFTVLDGARQSGERVAPVGIERMTNALALVTFRPRLRRRP